MTIKTTKSKFFRGFVEGQTISDGRTVTAEMIDQAVETFNAETYSPGINIEHLSGFSPEGPFNRYGDVSAVKAQVDDVTIAGKTEKRKALYMQVDALDSLVALAASGQKPFPSVELTGDYAGTGKVGLVGLAFTDNPASIATQKLNFSRGAAVNGNLVAKGEEAVTLEFEIKPQDTDTIVDGLFSRFMDKIRGSKEPEKKLEPASIAEPANFTAALEDLTDTFKQALAAAVNPLSEGQAALTARFDKLEGQLSKTEQPNQFRRQPSPGGAGGEETDC